MPNVYEKICAVEFDRLPEPIKKAYFVQPVISVLIELENDGFRLSTPRVLDKPANVALIPKLGIKSWRDSGTLGVIYEGVNILTIVERLLQKPTLPQQLVARAWIKTNLPLKLYLSPYMDFSSVSEVRFLINPRECHRISACLRGQTTQDFDRVFPQMVKFAKYIAQYLPPYSHVIDIGYSTGGIRLVDVNPGLTPKDFDTILHNTL